MKNNKIKSHYPIIAIQAFDWAGAVDTTESYDADELKESIILWESGPRAAIDISD